MATLYKRSNSFRVEFREKTASGTTRRKRITIPVKHRYQAEKIAHDIEQQHDQGIIDVYS